MANTKMDMQSLIQEIKDEAAKEDLPPTNEFVQAFQYAHGAMQIFSAACFVEQERQPRPILKESLRRLRVAVDTVVAIFDSISSVAG